MTHATEALAKKIKHIVAPFEPSLLSQAIACAGDAKADRAARRLRHYAQSYWVHVRTAQDALASDLPPEHIVHRIAAAAYSWMPTALTSVGPSPMPEAVSPALALFRSAHAARDIEAVIKALSAAPPINNSWVGTSKALHFIAPSVCPIWDSVVAERLGFGVSGLNTNRQKYVAYLRAMHMAKDDVDTDRISAAIVRAFGGPSPSPIRCIETALFLRAFDSKSSASTPATT